MAFRNNGIYVLLFSFPFAVLLLKNKTYVLIIFIIPILLFEGYNKLLLPNIGVSKAQSIREMSSVPSQQFARVYTYDTIEPENLEKLKHFYNLENFNYYKINPSLSDLMKAGLDNDYTEKNLDDYAKLWISVGVKHPINYIEAFLLNTLGYWYPNKNYYDSRIYHNYAYYNMLDAKLWNKEYIDINRHSLIKPYDRALEYTFEKNIWKYIPIINSLFTIGFYFIIILYSLIINLINKNKSILVPYSVIIGLYFTLLLSPVAMLRYFFPILILMPIIFSDINVIKKTNNN